MATARAMPLIAGLCTRSRTIGAQLRGQGQSAGALFAGAKAVGKNRRVTVSTMAAADAGKLTYFAGLKSRGEPTQLIAAYGGVKMEVELIDFEEWGKRKGVVANFLPYITNPDGTIMVETTVICKHLATLGGKFVVDAKQEELCEIANGAPIQLADPVYNTPEKGAPFGVPPFEEWQKSAAEVLKDYVTKLGDGPFFAGETPGYAEAFVFHNLDNCFAIDKAGFTELVGAEGMAKLEAFYDKFAALDGVKDYLAKRPTTWGLPGSIAQS